MLLFILLISVIVLGIAVVVLSRSIDSLAGRMARLEQAIAMGGQVGAAQLAPAAGGGRAMVPESAAPSQRQPISPPPTGRPVELPAAAASAPIAMPAPIAAPAHAPSQPVSAPPRSSRWTPTSGQAFAIAGGVFVLIGAALFITMAISNGWIGPRMQVVLGELFGVALFAVGAVVGWRRGHDTATLVAVGVGAGVVQLVNMAGAQRLEVVPEALALVVAVIAGGAALAWGVRQSSSWLAAFGLVTALASPVLVGAQASSAALALLAVALVASTVAVVIRGWAWLAVAALLVTAPQVLAWSQAAGANAVGLVCAAWWLIMFAAAIGFDALHGAQRLRASSATLLFLAAGTTSLLLRDGLGERAELVALLALAIAHLGAAFALAVRSGRGERSTEFATWIGVVGAGVLAIAVGEAFEEGAGRVPFWTIEAVALFAVHRARADIRAGAAAAVLAVIAIFAAWGAAPPWLAIDGTDALAPVFIAVGSLVVGSVVALLLLIRDDGRVLDSVPPAAGIENRPARAAREVAAMLVNIAAGAGLWLAAIVGFELGGIAGRVSAMAVVAALVWSAYTRRQSFVIVAVGAALTTVVVLDALASLISPVQLWLGSGDLAQSILGALVVAGLGVVIAAAGRAVSRGPLAGAAVIGIRVADLGAAIVACTVLYGASVLLVTVLTPNPPGVDPAQAAQLGLSTFWACAALVGIVAGLARSVTAVHRAAAVLLAVSGGKVLLVDTSQLDSAYRVGTFIGVGLLMLVGGFAYLRMAGSAHRS